jgi:BMFP domain-containing protein YqiC
MESDPRKLFERLFGQGDTAQERKAIAKQYSSILDLVSQEAADLQRSLDAPDRARLGDYLESVREIERRVQKMEAQDLSSLDLPEVPGRRELRSASEPDVRHDRARLSGEPDARLHLHDGG